jgi:hypothetical protein
MEDAVPHILGKQRLTTQKGLIGFDCGRFTSGEAGRESKVISQTSLGNYKCRFKAH